MSKSRRFGFKVERQSGHRSTYDWWDQGDPDPRIADDPNQFVVIRHYLPQPIHGVIDDYMIGPEVHQGPSTPNDAHPLEAEFKGLAIHLDDWPTFLKIMHKVYMGDRMPLSERQMWMGIEPNEQGIDNMLPPGALSEREVATITCAIDYTVNHAEAGIPGHGLLILVAKMAKLLGA